MSNLSDKIAAKKILKQAKKHPDWYTEQDIYYAKMMKKKIKAQEKLREALAFAARSEKPYISKHISDMMMKIDCLNEVSTLIDHVEDQMKSNE